MSPRQPVINAKDLIKALKRKGFVLIIVTHGIGIQAFKNLASHFSSTPFGVGNMAISPGVVTPGYSN
jgi:hypothetical protein